jgi:hypothetical protein
MPFTGHGELPFVLPQRIPINVGEARAIFEAFDENLNGLIHREEFRELLIAVGMSVGELDAKLELIFKESPGQEVDWDMFRLWVQRRHLVDREVGWKERIFLTLESPTCSKLSILWAAFMVFCVILSAIQYMLESHPAFRQQPCPGCEPELANKELFAWTETTIINAFCFDYITRLLTAHSKRNFNFKEFSVLDYFLHFQVLTNTKNFATRAVVAREALLYNPMQATINWVVSPMNLIDFVSIMPYFLDRLDLPKDATLLLRVLRLCRLLRLFKLKKYSSGFEVFFSTLSKSAESISLLIFIMCLLLVFLGALTYLAEGGTWYKPDDLCGVEVMCKDAGYPQGAYLRWDFMGQNLVETPFLSMFDACWFCLATITSVGYGDLSPTSPVGMTIAMICMALGTIALAMPITVLGENFGVQFGASQHAELQLKTDTFYTLQLGLERYRKLLDNKSPEYRIATDELQKLETAREWLQHQYGEVDEKLNSTSVIQRGVKEISADVAGLNGHMGQLERKAGEVMGVLAGMA